MGVGTLLSSSASHAHDGRSSTDVTSKHTGRGPRNADARVSVGLADQSDGGNEMPKLRAAFFSIIILTPGIGATAVGADRCQEISNHYFEQYAALAQRRLKVGQTELAPSPSRAGPEYCKLTRQMLSVATEWVSVMRGCGGEWQTPTKKAKERNLIRTAREQLRVACPSTNYQ